MTDGLPFSILCVDDDEDDRFLLDDAFLSIGYGQEIKKFKSGPDLFHYLEQIKPSLYPSLIVLDNNLGVDSAGDILSRLKREPNYKAIPVVIYSGAISKSRKAELLALGAEACFQKGDNMKDLQQLAQELKALAEHN